MNSIDNLKEKSVCFGKAFDKSIKECKLCYCSEECSILSSGKCTKPKSPLADKISKELSNKSKGNLHPTVSYPDFKNYSMEDLEKLAIERNADPSWQKYDNKGIRRMRLTMAIKKTYNSDSE